MAKEEVSRIDATPSKRIYRSIIADYGLNTAICELVDNAIDAWMSPKKTHPLRVGIDIDVEQQSIQITDNSGGVPESQLRKLISPGESSTSGEGESIGIFGVGSKRSVVALSQQVQISTRYRKYNSFRVEYDDEWLLNDSWELPYHVLAENLPPSSTTIALSRLRFGVSEADVTQLGAHLAVTYAYIISRHAINIQLGGKSVMGRRFDAWAYPPELKPHRITKAFKPKDASGAMQIEITGGLRRDRSEDSAEYGVYFYCNNRLTARALKSAEVGYMTGVAGMPHHVASSVRVLVSLVGPSSNMPWNSSKTGINYNHTLFKSIQHDLIEIVKRYTAISRKLSDEYEDKVQPYDTGEITEEKLTTTEQVKPSRLPAIPQSKTRPETILDFNQSLSDEKPWVRGLCESLVAEEMISRKRELSQQTRLSLIILDSTVEIALKDYLAYEIPHPLADDKLKNLFANRIAVHSEAKKTLTLPESFWTKMEYFYKLRCDLIHKRASAGISKADISEYRKVVERLLKATFGVRFPKK